jgi:transposase-like protein
MRREQGWRELSATASARHVYRRFRCRCGKQFNERSASVLNKAQYPSDVIALVVFWRLRHKLSLRDLAEMFLTRGFIFTYEAVREWEAKLTPALSLRAASCAAPRPTGMPR